VIANFTVDAGPLFTLVGASPKGCAGGYGGLACKDCVRPGYYRLGDRCLPCPQTPYAVIVFFALGLGTFADAAWVCPMLALLQEFG
jgi:hypothetical protein